MFATRKLRRRIRRPVVSAAELLEYRALLSAVVPAIELHGRATTILPAVNGVQMLGIRNAGNTDLYTTDGTQAGTVQIGTIAGYLEPDVSLTSGLADFVVVGANLYFAMHGATSSVADAVWKTDGTAAGTILLMTQNTAAELAPSGFQVFNGSVYFAAETGAAGRELWKSNGTALGTTLAVDVIAGSADSNPTHFQVFDGQLFFTSDVTQTVYRTDGTTVGTVEVLDGDTKWSPLTNDQGSGAFAVANSRLILKRETTASGVELLSMTSATAAPVVIRTFVPPTGSQYVVDTFLVVGGNAYFRRGHTSGNFSGEVWKTDGTVAGTAALPGPVFFQAPVSKFGLENSQIAFRPVVLPTVNGDRLVFFAEGLNNGLFWTDGTTLTQIPEESVGNSSATALVTIQNQVYVLSGGYVLTEVASSLDASKPIAGFSRFVDGTARQLKPMLGGLWFVGDYALWKLDATLPDTVAAPSFTKSGTGFESTIVNGQRGYALTWTPVSGAAKYLLTWSDPDNGRLTTETTATNFHLPHTRLGQYRVHVQAVMPSGQRSEVAQHEFEGLPNQNNVQYAGAVPFEQKVRFTRDVGSPNILYTARFVDRVAGRELHVLNFRWSAAVNGVESVELTLPASVLPAPDRLSVRFHVANYLTIADVTTVNFNFLQNELSITSTGSGFTITWPDVAGPDEYDIWINDVTRNVNQYVRDMNLTTNSYSRVYPAGTYRAWVRSKSSGPNAWSQPITFTVAGPPQVSSPAGSYIIRDSSETFRWSAVQGATGYELWVNKVGGPVKIVYEPSLGANTTSFTPASLLPAGRYQAWVRSQGTGTGHGAWSAVSNFTIVPKPVTPMLASSSFVRAATIAWNASVPGTAYELWIGNSTGAQVFRQTGITTTSFTLPVELADGQYQISVRGTTPDGLVLNWSDATKARFTIGLTGTTAAGINGHRTLVWNLIPGATHYDIWVNYVSGGQPPQAQIYRNMNATGNTQLLPSTLPAGQYRVWIRGVRIEGGVTFYTPWTAVPTNFTL